MAKHRTLRITETAEQNLSDIWAFIAQDNPDAATRFVREIEKRFKPLLADPQIGSRRDHLAEGLRVHFYRDDALYYRHSDIDVILVRVVHGARDTRALSFADD
ncbi:MAG: type II toxin-antitoxin system RelE/ParE family toxin [Thiohalocapsa sp.]|nr:type II toxin-antitoxin system RelE/ParE family toxin [Thiohalocapsa sp.]MCF7989207.1 type II toxin-antitoxin system RelE/ParE family toxin [Thiohalocapsa sp.]